MQQILNFFNVKIQSLLTLKLFLVLIFGIELMASCCSARKLDDIYWNSSNTMFDISNTEQVKSVELLDRVTIICPRPTPLQQKYEFTKLYLVSREGYENCELREEKQLGVCTTPELQSSISVVFRDFSPLSSLLQFRAGQSYYVITTSNGSYAGLNRTSGGLCSTSNMRMKFDMLQNSMPKNFHKSNSNLQSLDSTSLFSILRPVNNESTSPPILYVIHTAEPENSMLYLNSETLISETLIPYQNQKTYIRHAKQRLENDTNDAPLSFFLINRVLIGLGLLTILKMNKNLFFR